MAQLNATTVNEQLKVTGQLEANDTQINGNLTVSATGVISGNGSSITSMNASNISSGTLSLDRHPNPGTASTTSASASGGDASWSTSVVSGVTISKDSKGHVTGVTVSSVKIPSNPDTNTTYSITSTSQGVLTVTPSSGSTSTVNIYSLGTSDSPTFAAVTAGSFNAQSDVRLKENFEPLKIEKSILDLPTYKFDFINGLKNQIGCKAQDLQTVCPEIVTEGSDGYLSIQESKIVYLLLEEVKKLRKEVDELRGK